MRVPKEQLAYLQACQGSSRTLNQLSTQGQTELQQLTQELQPSCAPPRDCANAANWTNSELASLQQYRNQTWVTNAIGAVEPLHVVELFALGVPNAGRSFLTWQMGKVVENSIVLGDLIRGAAGSAIAGAGLFFLTHLSDTENITPANLLIAGAASAIGSGLVKWGLNLVAGLPNTLVPLSASNLVTQGTGVAFGFGTAGWLNQPGIPRSGESFVTRPILFSPSTAGERK